MSDSDKANNHIGLALVVGVVVGIPIGAFLQATMHYKYAAVITVTVLILLTLAGAELLSKKRN